MTTSNHLRVTVCELSTETPEALEKDWKILASHLFENHTDLVLLPGILLLSLFHILVITCVMFDFYVSNRWLNLLIYQEMPFHKWLPESNEYNSEKWLKSIKDHEKWINDRLDELNCPVIIGTRPAMRYHNFSTCFFPFSSVFPY